jgi:N-acetylneuraminic acid mutarotase
MTRAAPAAGFVLLLLALCAGSAPLRAADPAGTWSNKAPMPAPREDHGVVTIDGKIYAIGGTAHQDAQIRRNEEYDPATDKWRALAPMPRGTHHVALAALGSRIYAFGGFTAPAHGSPVDVAFEYDLKADSWRALPALSSPRGSPAAVALGGSLHVVGGRGTDGATVATHEVFDPASGLWSAAAPLPKARDHIALIVVGGKMHSIGGRLASTNTNQTLHDVYDPATNSWSPAAPMPTARSSTAVELYHGMIVVVGGEGDATGPGSAFKDNEGYDLKTGQWLKLQPLPLGKHALGAATVGNVVYFPGGSSTRGGEGVTAEMLTFTLPQ